MISRRFDPILIFGILLILLGHSLPAQKFLADDPIWVDNDRIPIEAPRPRELSQIVDFLNSNYRHRPEEGETIVTAENVNSLGARGNVFPRIFDRVRTFEARARLSTWIQGRHDYWCANRPSAEDRARPSRTS